MDEPTGAIPVQTKPGGRSLFPRLLVWILIVFIVYPLSYIPARILSQAYPGIYNVVEITYAPLTALASRHPSIAKFYIWCFKQVYRL